MNNNKNLEFRLQQQEFSEKREPDPERVELKKLFYALEREYGTGRVLKDIEMNIEIAPNVVSEWLEDKRFPTLSIRRNILNYLRELFKELPALVEAPKPVIVSEPEVNLEKAIETAPKPMRKRKSYIPNRWEDVGRYEGLNIYESDLLDYLKKNFTSSANIPNIKFEVKDIKFEEKNVRGHIYIFHHLAYLRSLGYIEGPTKEDGKYYYRVKN